VKINQKSLGGQSSPGFARKFTALRDHLAVFDEDE